MIICGYQGVGKSTLAGRERYIDLESGNFWIEKVMLPCNDRVLSRDPDWYIPYCNIAVHLSKQGYDVFLSSHECVRQYLATLHTSEKLLLVFPSLSLKDQWIEKLHQKYNQTQSNKDWKALKNAEDIYEESIQDLMNQDGFDKIILHEINYDLQDLLNQNKEVVKE